MELRQLSYFTTIVNEGNISQAKALQQAGCEILRVAVPDLNAVKLIPAR